MNPPGIVFGTLIRDGLQLRNWFATKPMLFAAAFSVTLLVWGLPITLLMSSIWISGWLVYRAVCSHYFPTKANPINYYLARGSVAYVTILLALMAAEGLTTGVGRPLAQPQHDGAAWLLVVFFSIPPFSLIEANDVGWYLRFLAGCLLTVLVYELVGLHVNLLVACSAVLSVLLIALLVWHFYTGLISKEQAAEKTWRELSRFAEEHRVQESSALRRLVQILDEVANYGHRTTLRFNVPAQSAWRTFTRGEEPLEWTPTSEVLEQIRRDRQPVWQRAQPDPALDPLALAYRLALPIPLEPQRRLRAVIEVAVDLSRSHPGTVALLRALRRVGLDGLFVKLFHHPSESAYDEISRGLLRYVPAIDQILDHWRTEAARRTFEDCAASILQYAENQSAQPVARTLADYFKCDVAIWHLDRLGQLGTPDVALTPTLDGSALHGERLTRLRDVTTLKRLLADRAYGVVVRSVRQLTEPDAEALTALGYTEFVACPIRHDARALGLVTLLGASGFQLTERERDWLRRVAELLGLGFVQAEADAQLEQMVMHVHDVTGLIQNLVAGGASAYAVRELHRAVAAKAQRILGADSIVLYGLDLRQSKIVHAVTAGDVGASDIASTFDGDSAVQRIIERGQPVFAQDAREDLYPRSRTERARPPFVERNGIASTFATPLIVRDTIIGVMFANFRQRQTFGDHPQRLFSLFASLAAHTLALSGYHREWTMATIVQDRRRLRDNFHRDVKGAAEMIRSELKDCRDDLQREPPRLGLVASAIERSISQCNTILETAGELLVAIDDRVDWTDLEQNGLRATLFKRATTLIGDEERRRIVLDYHEARRLPLSYEKCLLDFGAEALLNAAKHARGAVVDVRLHQRASDVTLVVADSGPGLSQAELDRCLAQGGFSTLRQAALDFEWRIVPRVGGGLEAALTVPVRDSM